MNNILLCPSMMCADFTNLSREVRELENAGIDIFHCDVMDCNFVPNMALGMEDLKAIRKLTKKTMDVHLMVEHPSKIIDLFLDVGADIIYIHPESERYVIKTLLNIKSHGINTGLAINPDTSIATIEEMLSLVDYLMVMTVNPGFSGQKFIQLTKAKIKRIVDMKTIYNYKIIIDGACSKEIIKEFSTLGVDGFILGTSSLFNKEDSYKDTMSTIRSL